MSTQIHKNYFTIRDSPGAFLMGALRALHVDSHSVKNEYSGFDQFIRSLRLRI